jgi:hypothetical protein
MYASCVKALVGQSPLSICLPPIVKSTPQPSQLYFVLGKINHFHHSCSLRLRRQANYFRLLELLLRHLSLPESQLSLSYKAHPQCACILRRQVLPSADFDTLSRPERGALSTSTRTFVGWLPATLPPAKIKVIQAQLSPSFVIQSPNSTLLFQYSNAGQNDALSRKEAASFVAL